jgi:hypothetical protein
MASSESQADPCLRVTYVIQAPPARIEARAEALLLEQTVELPRSAIRDPCYDGLRATRSSLSGKLTRRRTIKCADET